MSRRWYVIQVKTNHEEIVHSELKNQRFAVFNPTYRGKFKLGRTEVERNNPLFPSYIFVQFDAGRHPRWRSIRHTRGVVAMIGCTETAITPVPEGYIEELIARVDDDGNVKLEEAIEETLKFVPGMEVEIIGDKYKNMMVTYCNQIENRVQLLITLLSRKIKVSLPIHAIRPKVEPHGQR